MRFRDGKKNLFRVKIWFNFDFMEVEHNISEPKKPSSESYAYKLVVSFDQLLNTICGGDPDTTLSGRVGYFSKDLKWEPRSVKTIYWKTIEGIIDWTYDPVQDVPHCLTAYEADRLERYDESKNIWPFLIIITLILIPVCFAVGVILHLLKKLGFIRFNKGNDLNSNKEKKLDLKTRIKKGFIKTLLIIASLIVILFCVVLALLIATPPVVMTFGWVILLMVLAIILIPFSMIIGIIVYSKRMEDKTISQGNI